MIYPVILVRMVSHTGFPADAQYYARRFTLPLAPFSGLSLISDVSGVLDKVDEVVVNQRGDLVCILEPIEWDHDDCSPEEWQSCQLFYFTRGWVPVGQDSHLFCDDPFLDSPAPEDPS